MLELKKSLRKTRQNEGIILDLRIIKTSYSTQRICAFFELFLARNFKVKYNQNLCIFQSNYDL